MSFVPFCKIPLVSGYSAISLSAEVLLTKEDPFRDDPRIKSIIPDFEKKDARFVGKKYGQPNIYFFDQFTKDDLDRSEILLLFAHFERFMQNLHKDLLQAADRNLAAIVPENEKGEKNYKNLEKFSDDRIFKDLEGFKSERIEWQVEEVNKKRINGKNGRAEYFKKLGIEWGKKNEIDLVQQISDLRNKISHESAHEPVPGELLKNAEQLLLKIPQSCYAQAKKLHAPYFKL